MKADLAIYSLIVGMSGQWENVATMLNMKRISAVVTIRSVFANISLNLMYGIALVLVQRHDCKHVTHSDLTSHTASTHKL